MGKDSSVLTRLERTFTSLNKFRCIYTSLNNYNLVRTCSLSKVPAADVYQNMKLSPPPRQTGTSPTPLTRPPEVDRSLKPSRTRHRSSTESASSPTSALAPVPVQELQPHIPPRLPDKKKISDTASAVGVIGVTRKESFTRRRNLPSVSQGPSMLASNGFKTLASADVQANIIGHDRLVDLND